MGQQGQELTSYGAAFQLFGQLCQLWGAHADNPRGVDVGDELRREGGIFFVAQSEETVLNHSELDIKERSLFLVCLNPGLRREGSSMRSDWRSSLRSSG